MHTIVRNETHRLRRGKQAVHISLDEVCSLGAEDPSPILRLDVERALRQLPRAQACAVGLYYLSGWPIEAIARHMARPEGTIKRWLHRGRRRLAAEMKGYFPMEQAWKACVVAPEITPAQLLRVTDALEAAGWADGQTVTNVRSLDDLYQIEKGLVRQLGPGIDPPRPQLAEPLASCHFLLLGEQIAGRSAFEFMPIVRAIRPRLPVGILIGAVCGEASIDSTIYAAWLSGFDLCISADQEAPVFQHWFRKLREDIQTTETME